MKIMKLIPLAIFVMLLISVSGFAQEEKKPSAETDTTAPKEETVQPDRWHGLTLNKTTPEQAIEILGEPKTRGNYKIFIQKIGDWLGKPAKEKMPAMKWSNIHGMQDVTLYFQSNKLVAIDLFLKAEVRAAALESIYGAKFQHLISNAKRDYDNSMRASNGQEPAYQRDRGETFSNKNEVSYHVGVVTEKSYIVAFCDVGFKESFKRNLGAGLDSARPGRVRSLQLFSRTLENRDGEDVLK